MVNIARAFRSAGKRKRRHRLPSVIFRGAIYGATVILLVALWRQTSSVRAALIEYVTEAQRASIVRAFIEDYAGGAIIGNASADQTIIAFVDYRCDACAVADSIFRDRLAVDRSTRLIVVQHPIEWAHPDAKSAALASICGEKAGGFDELHEALFSAAALLTHDALMTIAEESGVAEMERFGHCLTSGASTTSLSVDRRLAERLGVRSVPAFVTEKGEIRGLAQVAELVEVRE